MATNKVIKGRSFKIQTSFFLDYDSGIVASLAGVVNIKTIFKFDPNDTDANAILTKQIGGGVTVLTPSSTGQCETLLTPTDTSLFVRNTIYYEVVAKLADGSLVGSGVCELPVDPNVLKTLF